MVRKIIFTSLVLILISLTTFSSVSGEVIFIKGGEIITMAGITINDGVIRIEENKITYVGRRLSIPQDALIIDATDKVITPGFILPYSRAGIPAEHAVAGSKPEPITPAFRALDVLYLNDPVFERAALHGISTIHSLPYSNRLMPGVGVLLKTYGLHLWDRIIKEESALTLNLAQPEEDEARDQSLASEVENILAIRNSFHRALNKKVILENPSSEVSSDSVDGHTELLLKVINRELPVCIYAQRPVEIERGVSLIEDFDLEAIFINISDVMQLKNRFSSQRLSMLLNPVNSLLQPVSSAFDTPEDTILQDIRNFRISLMVDNTNNRLKSELQNLSYFAALLRNRGLTDEEALGLITSQPAKMLGVEDRIGSIEVGKDADINIFSSHPMVGQVLPDIVLVDGVVVTERGR